MAYLQNTGYLRGFNPLDQYQSPAGVKSLLVMQHQFQLAHLALQCWQVLLLNDTCMARINGSPSLSSKVQLKGVIGRDGWD